MSRTTVVIDAANDPRLARDLTAGGAFVVGYDLAISDECDLVVHNGNVQVRLDARVVYVDPVDPAHGAGLELVGFGASLRDQLTALIAGEAIPACEDEAPGRARTGSSPPPSQAIGSSPDVQIPISAASLEAARRRAGRASVMRPAATGSNPNLALVADEPAGVDDAGGRDDDDDDDERRDPLARTVAGRLRGISLAEQIKLAHSGELNERIILERLYGKNVWEALLRNPRLTAPEIARIARMGALPRIHLEIIMANNAWLGMPDVRRALLTNPRMSTEQVVKILRMLPKPELRLLPTQMSLPMAVREAAKKLLRGEG